MEKHEKAKNKNEKNKYFFTFFIMLTAFFTTKPDWWVDILVIQK